MLDPSELVIRGSDKDINPLKDTISFLVKDYEMLRIDKEGIIYRGTRVKDAGEAYTAYMETMKAMQKS